MLAARLAHASGGGVGVGFRYPSFRSWAAERQGPTTTQLSTGGRGCDRETLATRPTIQTIKYAPTGNDHYCNTHAHTHALTHTHNWVTAMLVLTLGRIGSGLLLLLAYCYFRFRCRGREYRVSTCYIDMCPLVYGLLLLATPEQPLCFYCRGGNGGAAVTRGRIYYCTNSIITKFHHYINTRGGNG